MSAGMMPPAPSGDLDSVDAIAEMVRRFYADVAQDDLLGPVFNDVARVDWSEHLPKLTQFWSRTVLGIRGYTGNPLAAHADVHAEHPFTPAHFERWLELFVETVELGWVGPLADRAKTLAVNVARVHHEQLVDRRPSAAADEAMAESDPGERVALSGVRPAAGPPAPGDPRVRSRPRAASVAEHRVPGRGRSSTSR